MSDYLLDTNIISELRKGDRCNQGVYDWHSSLAPESVWLSVLVVGEIRRGIELLRPSDPAQAAILEKWLEGLATAYSTRIIPVDVETAQRWGVLNAKRTMSYTDGFLAATALEKNLVFVTRNTSDVEGVGVKLLHPFL